MATQSMGWAVDGREPPAATENPVVVLVWILSAPQAPETMAPVVLQTAKTCGTAVKVTP